LLYFEHDRNAAFDANTLYAEEIEQAAHNATPSLDKKK
jgi:hypothetical protein